MKIAYKGTSFHGWQALSAQGKPEPYKTVQGSLREVLLRIAKYQDCSVIGTSRTDAGVHATGQIGKLILPVEIDASKLLLGMNSLLPPSIRLMECCRCPASFNPKTARTRKEYEYHFSVGPVANPLWNDVVAHISDPLDVDKMRQAAQLFVGVHDFYNYCPSSSLTGSSVREVYVCDIAPVPSSVANETGQVYVLRVSGSGFLKYMVRFITGVLFDVGRGKVSLAQVADSLSTHREEKLSKKASAQGLVLAKIVSLDL
ncbi:MAG: tRNA pseudouridine(38-40) synthase TruA [Kofleriaceae bacterium]|nr:tRNA pseudouridine(38-40) synthase TruA [Kofleriaceae bacterium]